MANALYRKFVSPVLFRFDPERTHDWLGPLGDLAALAPIRSTLAALYGFSSSRLETELFGVRFANPFGVAAGFDKHCRLAYLLGALGFGHIEVGTITGQPQPGNPRPRIFRFPVDQALINRMGFPSEGAEAIAPRLAKLRRCPGRPVIAVNIGKTKTVPIDQAVGDYLQSFEVLRDFGDLFVLNVSSPNTPELRKLQEPARLRALYGALREKNTAGKPLLVKVAPDLSDAELEEVIGVCLDERVSGIIATNTTSSRDGLSSATEESGGLSGSPLRQRSLAMVRRIYLRTEGKLPIIGVGGVSDLRGVIDLLLAGASLVQIYTAIIYEGPGIAGRLSRELDRYLAENGIANVAALVGQGGRSNQLKSLNSSATSAAAEA